MNPIFQFETLYACFLRVVTGEKNSPTAAHSGRKRRPKWVPRTGGVGDIAVLPCPKVNKYGWLAFQVVGWATSQQPVTVKKLAVRKRKLWDRPRQWKRINPLKTKSRLLYLKTQFVPRSKHSSSRL